MNGKMDRRGFFATFVKMAGVAVIAPTVLNTVFGSEAHAQKKRGAAPEAAPAAKSGGMPFVDPNDSVAKAVKYVEDHKKAPEAKGNHCVTCGFYGKKDATSGTCTIFAGKLVHADGWCASWNKKA
ncbi:high-potential iron-sulfur protein [Bdellovibrio sp. HCB288]|uniref:high-potential iron-sulfur protein n=1 Tax=Bdellovibrio sp. HCB288 TaxID=3394355 RepID=UPI0039B4DF5E